MKHPPHQPKTLDEYLENPGSIRSVLLSRFHEIEVALASGASLRALARVLNRSYPAVRTAWLKLNSDVAAGKIDPSKFAKKIESSAWPKQATRMTDNSPTPVAEPTIDEQLASGGAAAFFTKHRITTETQ